MLFKGGLLCAFAVVFLGTKSLTTAAEDRSARSLDGPSVVIGYRQATDHGCHDVTIQNGEAIIVTPGNPSVTSKIPVAADEVEYFLALLNLGNFFNVPSFPPPTAPVIIDGSTSTLTLTLDGKTHTADCTDTHDPYLKNVLELLWQIGSKQEFILGAEAMVAAGTPPREPLPRWLPWHAPLQAQREEAGRLLNELLDRHPVEKIVSCAPDGKIDEISVLANARTLDILIGKLQDKNQRSCYVIDAMGSTGDPRAVPVLLNLLAAGDHAPRIIHALARLDCQAVLEEALAQRYIIDLGYLGRDDRRAVAMVEGEAYGWFTERHPRAVATQALARMGRLPTPTKAGLFAHVLFGLLILCGCAFLIVPRRASRLLISMPRIWSAGIGTACVLAGIGVLYMLHFAVFF